MKNLTLVILFVSTLQVSFSQSSKTKTDVIKTEIACDHCAVCESCDQNIFMKIKENTKGVKSVKINSETNTVTVKYSPKKTNLEEIEKAITLAGYKANDREPTSEAYEKLDGCCKRK